MLVISVLNESTTVADEDVRRLLPAVSTQWNRDLKAAWGVRQAEFSLVAQGKPAQSQSWWVALFDNADQASALGYHDLTDEGLPLAKIFVDELRDDETILSIGASHEICELAVDPWLNAAYQDVHGAFWAADICDPVEDDQYGYDIGGVLVSDFVLPSWYSRASEAGPYDFMEHTHAPFEVLAGGRAHRFDPQQGWQQLAGSRARLSARVINCAHGSRRERRTRQWNARLERSEPETWTR